MVCMRRVIEFRMLGDELEKMDDCVRITSDLFLVEVQDLKWSDYS